MSDKKAFPEHVAIILDGNGRWAKSKGMPRNYGHTMGAKNVEVICEDAYHMGIQYLTLYAFSTENWNRPQNEVDALMKLLSSYLIEKKENEIFITSKAKQLLSLVPEDLKKPELTAEWESRLSAIAKGKASDRKFMREIATYTKELMKQIQNLSLIHI